jgi:hypothetical protein
MGSQVSASSQAMSVQYDLFGKRVEQANAGMEVSNRRLMLTSAGMIANSVQLADVFDRMASGQVDAGRGALLLGMNLLQLASQIWVVVGAETARATASAIANALTPAGWAVLAGAGAAAAVGMALVSQIPKMAGGGVVTGPTVALIGESGPEAVVPLSSGFGGSSITVHVHGVKDYAEAYRGAYDGTREALRIDELQRKGAFN